MLWVWDSLHYIFKHIKSPRVSIIHPSISLKYLGKRRWFWLELMFLRLGKESDWRKQIPAKTVVVRNLNFDLVISSFVSSARDFKQIRVWPLLSFWFFQKSLIVCSVVIWLINMLKVKNIVKTANTTKLVLKGEKFIQPRLQKVRFWHIF